MGTVLSSGFDEAFDVMYLPHSANTGDGEVEIEEDDLETAFYRDEVIDLAWRFYGSLGLKHISLNLNSIGCKECVEACPFGAMFFDPDRHQAMFVY
jgi:ferredoxin